MELQKSSRFSITFLLVLTALIAAVVSHVMVSSELAKTKADLTALRNEVLVLDVVDDSLMHVVSLPTYGDLQWRWKVQLPADGQYRIKFAIDNIPVKSFDVDAEKLDRAFLGSDGKPIQGGMPFVLELSIHKNSARWIFDANNGDSGRGLYIDDPPSWFGTYSKTGWGSSVAGTRGTETASPGNSLELLRMRKSKVVGNASEVDMQPADGLLVWLERID